MCVLVSKLHIRPLKEGAATSGSTREKRSEGVDGGLAYLKAGLIVALTLDLAQKIFAIQAVYLLVERINVTILFLSGCKDATSRPRGAPDIVSLVGFGHKEFQLERVNGANVKIVFLLGHQSDLGQW